MAFTTPLTINGEAQAAAYIKAYIRHGDAQRTVVQLEVYTNQAARNNGALPVPDSFLTINTLHSFTTDLNLEAANPVDYAYKLLEASGLFPDATWNV
jgi:hypothetical protein